MKKNDIYFMEQALNLAKSAEIKEEVPVGAVLVLNNIIIGEGANSSITRHDPTAHAEIIALRSGGTFLKNYRLLSTTLYVTLEPCFMCYGAILHSRISRLVFGTSYKKCKKNYTHFNDYLLKTIHQNKIKITKNVLQEDCKNILKFFFQHKRKNNF
ncbi:MAG: tRNA adenosine(34) deaminase TadA [Buchnera aphidicola (Nurudea yanoniella)]